MLGPTYSTMQFRILIPLMVVAACTSVWSNSTRTPKLEILRSPTKVAVWKPDPYPILLRNYGDEVPDDGPAVPSVRNLTSLPSNRTLEDSTKSENETSSDVINNSTAVLNSTEVNNSTNEPQLDTFVAKNDTCVRRDYEEDVAAVFKEEAGPIESAELVFNSTVQFFEGKISNVTDLLNLQVLNETVVDCGTYFKLNNSLDAAVSQDNKT